MHPNILKPYTMNKCANTLVISDFHPAHASRNPGYASLLTSWMQKNYEPFSPIVLNGDMGPSSEEFAIYGDASLEWNRSSLEFWKALADHRGAVYYIPGNHEGFLRQQLIQHKAPFFIDRVIDDWPAEGYYSQEYLDILRSCDHVLVVPELIVPHENTRTLVSHGDDLDFVLPVYRQWLKFKARVLGLPPQESGSQFGRKVDAIGRMLFAATGSGYHYAEKAKWYDCQQVILGHWHCPGHRWRNVHIASCATDGFCTVAELSQKGNLIRHDLLA